MFICTPQAPFSPPRHKRALSSPSGAFPAVRIPPPRLPASIPRTREAKNENQVSTFSSAHDTVHIFKDASFVTSPPEFVGVHHCDYLSHESCDRHFDLMANLIRSAKSGSNWGMNELIAFNIRVNTVNTQTFFGSSNLPRITVSPVILDNLEEPADSLHKADMDFFAYMEDAMTILPGEESFVDDFVAFLLKMMGYDEGRRVIHLRKEMGFEMCGQRVDVRTDVCVMERPGTGAKYLPLVQEDTRHLSKDDPEPQLIAEAITAFYETNRALRAAGLPPLQSKTFAGITMIGTAPTFYKIPVTEELLTSLATSQYPPQVTTVEKLIPPVPSPERLVNDGMKPLVNRRIILQCFEAFKQFVYWDESGTKSA